MLLVIQDQLRDHSLVDFDRWEFILSVFDDHGRQLSEVLGDLGGTRLHDQSVLVVQLGQKLAVVIDAFQKGLWFELRDE